jgi:phospholipid:diacylglycerol acyltransferase
LYGVGKPTERSYAFKFNSSDLEIDHTNNQGSFGAGVGCEDGDGTVPLESLGFVCQSEKIWKGKTEHNPSGMKVKTKEYRHAKYNKLDMGGSSPMSAFIQGGPSSADHVDILGNYLLIGDLLDIVTKEGIGGVEEMESVIHSELMEMVEEVDKQL